jgi:predicted nuclease of predicted toxin-antitoxin system
VRVLLDHDVSGPRVGARLSAHGHDVRALDQQPQHAGLADDEVLRLATSDGRIVVTHDVNTFPPLLRDFAERGDPHAGAIVLVAIRSRDFDLIVRAVEAWLARYPRQEQWRDLTAFATQSDAAQVTDPEPSGQRAH